VLREQLGPDFPCFEVNVYQTNLVGVMCVGNEKGLLVPSIIQEEEMKILREFLPESVDIGKLDDFLTAIGNCISTNDSVALIHPEYSRENEEII
jgi:translation initiation factor 6